MQLLPCRATGGAGRLALRFQGYFAPVFLNDGHADCLAVPSFHVEAKGHLCVYAKGLARNLAGRVPTFRASVGAAQTVAPRSAATASSLLVDVFIFLVSFDHLVFGSRFTTSKA